MIQRIYNLIDEATESSIFLFGARQTGKSIFLKQQFGDCIIFDLLDSDLKLRLKNCPSLLFEMLQDKPDETLIVIDEIPNAKDTTLLAGGQRLAISILS